MVDCDVFWFDDGRAEHFVCWEDEQWFQWCLEQPEVTDQVDCGYG